MNNTAVQPRDKKLPYNAADETMVGEASARSKLKEDERVKGLRHLMSATEGRAWMHFLLTKQMNLGRPIFTGNSSTFYNSAQRELADILVAELKRFCFESYMLMEKENQDG